MRGASIRLRLTLWYGAVLSITLVVFSVAVSLLMRHHLLAQADAGLAEELTELADEVVHAASPDQLGPRYSQHEGYELQITDGQGRVLFRSERLGSESLPADHAPPGLAGTRFSTAALPALGPVRIASRSLPTKAGPLLLQAATPLDPFHRASRELTAALLLTGAVAAAASVGIGYLLARKALAPVDRMVAAAAEITSTRLDRRLEVPPASDELARLARTLNDMIERLERSFARIKRFTADAAHELRTPLSVIRSSAELALRRPRDPDKDRRALEELLEESDRLARIVAQLLDLCREERGIVAANRTSVRLDELVHDVADLMQVAAEEKGIALSVEDFPPCRVPGDEDQLRQLLINLLDNALKYTPSSGSVVVRGDVAEGLAHVQVIDTGCGIAGEHLPHIFERFYRADPARGRDTEGTGLGLSICRSIAEAHGGRITLESEPGRGTRVDFSLPCESAPRQATVARRS